VWRLWQEPLRLWHHLLRRRHSRQIRLLQRHHKPRHSRLLPHRRALSTGRLTSHRHRPEPLHPRQSDATGQFCRDKYRQRCSVRKRVVMPVRPSKTSQFILMTFNGGRGYKRCYRRLQCIKKAAVPVRYFRTFRFIWMTLNGERGCNSEPGFVCSID
jgi:hypothetical protein